MRLVASAADNASSNGTMNDEIVRLVVKYFQMLLDADEIQIGCAGHVTNIITQYVGMSLIC